MCASCVDAGVVDENIHRTEFQNSLFEKRGHALLVGDVALARPRASSGRAHRRFELPSGLLSFPVRDSYGRAALHQQVGDASADAAGSAGDDSHAAVKEEI